MRSGSTACQLDARGQTDETEDADDASIHNPSEQSQDNSRDYMFAHLNDSNLGIVSQTFFHLIHGNKTAATAADDELARALGELAMERRRGTSTSLNKDLPCCAEGIARGLLVDDPGNLRFSNGHVQELAETWTVIEHLQPDYVDRANMYDRAVQHLARIGAGAVPLLVELLGNRATSVANGAAFALGEIGNDALPALRWAILFGNARVRAYALKALTIAKKAAPLSDDLLDLVVTVLSEDGHAMVKDEAIMVLSDTKHPVAIEALKRALAEPVTKSLASDALARLNLPEARRALDDAQREVASKTVWTPQGGWQIEAPRAQPAPKRTPRVFMSYAREDASVMEEYRRRLKLSGFDVWSDSQQLIAGEQWENRLIFAINSSDFVVGLLSASTWDGYQRVEIAQAIAERAKRDVPFFLPLFLRREEWTTGCEHWPAGLDDSHVIVADSFTTGWTQLYRSMSEAARMSGLSIPPRLRAERSGALAERDVWRMVFDKDFFSLQRNPNGKPLGGADEWDLVMNGMFAADRATGLTWTRSPVTECNLSQALRVPGAYRARMNELSLACPGELRLPTLEEAMSLMTLGINREGDHRTNHMSGSHFMLTADTIPAPPGADFAFLVWVADFLSTDMQPVPVESPWPVWLVASS